MSDPAASRNPLLHPRQTDGSRMSLWLALLALVALLVLFAVLMLSGGGHCEVVDPQGGCYGG